MKQNHSNIWLLILVMSVLRLIVGGTIALGNDEVYYWTYAQHLQWNYFDHPPMVAALIRLTTLNLALHQEIFVRLGAIIASAICTWLIYQTGSLLRNPRTGWIAALLYTSSFYSSIIAGTFILPDSPQMIFWLGSILILLKIYKASNLNQQTLILWCWFGVLAGLCMLCKIHGVFLWVAVGLYAIFLYKKWLYDPGLYIAAFISLILFSPVIIWNFQHDFITYSYHGSRISLAGANLNLLAFGRELLGELFYNNPIVFVLIWISIWKFCKGKYHGDNREIKLLLCCSIPLILTLISLSLFRDTLPHWSGPAYSCLILLSAVQLADSQKARLPKVVWLSITLFLMVILSGLLVVNFYPGTLHPTQDIYQYGKGDPTLDLYGWRETGKKIDSLYQSDRKSGLIRKESPIVINKWFPAAHLDFYVAALTKQNTYGLGDIFDLHQYYWSNTCKPQLTPGEDAYFIIPSNLFDQTDLDTMKSHFKSAEKASSAASQFRRLRAT